MGRHFHICRQAVHPRLAARENCQASTCILAMLAVLGGLLCVAERISGLAD
jgi:hypothetical protein